jgi:hypothetical protein
MIILGGEMKQGSWLSVDSPAALILLFVELADRHREMVIYIKVSFVRPKYEYSLTISNQSTLTWHLILLQCRHSERVEG